MLEYFSRINKNVIMVSIHLLEFHLPIETECYTTPDAFSNNFFP